MTPLEPGSAHRNPAIWRSRRLWSLWDMLTDLAQVFLLLEKEAAIRRTVEQIMEKLGPTHVVAIKPETREKRLALEEQLRQMKTFPSMCDALFRIFRLLDNHCTAQQMLAALDEFNHRAEDELTRLKYYHVSAELVPYYETSMLFGQEVNDKFSSAIDDIEGAGKCLALGQGTAAVLHLMRVMEVGLKALAKGLGIPYAPSWESYLKQIQDRIAAKHKTKGIRWKRDEPFYRDISGDLLTVKQAWRNPTMHVVRKYDPQEAEEIFRAVRSFMGRLAPKLSQV